MTPRPAPLTARRRSWRGPAILLALLPLVGAAGAAELPPAGAGPLGAGPLLPPQSLLVPPRGLGGSLGGPLPESGSADRLLPSVPLQWPGEGPVEQPWPRDSRPAAPRGGPGPPPEAASPPQPLRQLVLDRHRRLLLLLENGRERYRYPVAVGMPGWETPVGRFEVIEKIANPIWEHPATGVRFKPGPANPLGSRWIGFHRDCRGRKGFNGVEQLELKGCLIAGFHGTPNRASVGRAVSHGCVRLYDENIKELFDLVGIGTPVTVLP